MRLFYDLQGQRLAGVRKLDPHGLLGRGGAMLDGERELVALPPQVEIAVAPSVELRGTAQRLPATRPGGAFLRVMDDDDGKRITALQLSQIGEQGSDLAAGVLIDA